jgi:hypothetical protein
MVTMTAPEPTRTIVARVNVYAESGPQLLELADVAATVFAGGMGGSATIIDVQLEEVNTTTDVRFTTDPSTVEWGAVALITVQVLGQSRQS